MKRKILFSTLAMLCFGGTAMAAGNSQALYQAAPGASQQVQQVGLFHDSACDEITCGCEMPCDCEVGCEPMCDDGGCDSGCDTGCGTGCFDSLCECDLGEPFALFGEHCGYAAGGWIQMGYHNHANSLFNSRPDNFQLHQAWLWAEKAIDTSNGFDIGGRIDYIYGTDGPDTQAFGIPNGHWDTDWTNGEDYGSAIPQLYVEAGYGDFSIKAGHFYTIIGWEVVTAPDNFFYSHAYTMYNSEPFTHTGAIGTYSVTDDLEVYGGWTMGWDSGFEDNGDNFIGGVSLNVSEDINLIYATVGGRFSEFRSTGPRDFSPAERGYMHSVVADVTVTDNLQYIFQSDYLDTQDANSNGVRNTFGINQYLIYTHSDCVASGARFEWYNQEGVYTDFGDETDIYALTLGVNLKPHANVLFRPEIRWDWDEDSVADLDEGDDQTTFGFDTILMF